MHRIHDENPAWWPYGLSVEHHDDLFLIRSASTREPVGFTGWQNCTDKSGKKIGYYSVGILPEFRNHGYAKEAVAKIISEKSSSCDEVRAFIVKGNTPSMRVAENLQIPVVHKVAAVKQAINWKAWAPILGGVGNAGFWDAYTNRHDYTNTEDVLGRTAMGLMNGALGGLGGHLIHNNHPVLGAEAMALSPIKDLALQALPAMPKLPAALDAIARSNQPTATPAPATPASDFKKYIPMLAAGGLGLGGLYAMNRLAGKVGDLAAHQAGGKIQVHLPAKHVGDQETTVEMPLSQIGLSGKLVGNIGRDTRRKLREESRERVWRRNPKTHKLITNEEDGDETETKQASFWLKAATMGNAFRAATPQKGQLRGGFQSTVNIESGAGSGSIEELAKQHEMTTKQLQSESDKKVKEHEQKANQAQTAADQNSKTNEQLKQQLAEAEHRARHHETHAKMLAEAHKQHSEINAEKLKMVHDLYSQQSKLQKSNASDSDWHPVLKHLGERAEQAGKMIQSHVSKIAAQKRANAFNAASAGLHNFGENHPVLSFASSLVPGVMTATSANDAYHNFRQGNFWSGVGDVASAGLGLIPGGGLVARGVKSLVGGVTKATMDSHQQQVNAMETPQEKYLRETRQSMEQHPLTQGPSNTPAAAMPTYDQATAAQGGQHTLNALNSQGSMLPSSVWKNPATAGYENFSKYKNEGLGNVMNNWVSPMLTPRANPNMDFSHIQGMRDSAPAGSAFNPMQSLWQTARLNYPQFAGYGAGIYGQ